MSVTIAKVGDPIFFVCFTRRSSVEKFGSGSPCRNLSNSVPVSPRMPRGRWHNSAAIAGFFDTDSCLLDHVGNPGHLNGHQVVITSLADGNRRNAYNVSWSWSMSYRVWSTKLLLFWSNLMASCISSSARCTRLDGRRVSGCFRTSMGSAGG
ncbi:hypothetical protein BC834DRAFT_158286 [Gloeopeniophorella convolvens]|nr:hypothetical protein BC834DRAFT_158286 [Gloeopeniophorella convolvens]